MTNAKLGKNPVVSSVLRKVRKASGGEILNGSEFVMERDVLPFWDCQDCLVEDFRKKIKSGGGVEISGDGNIMEPTLVMESVSFFLGYWNGKRSRQYQFGMSRWIISLAKGC